MSFRRSVFPSFVVVWGFRSENFGYDDRILTLVRVIRSVHREGPRTGLDALLQAIQVD